MFWDKGYTPSQNIEALLEKGNATLEEFLDDDDILQECKTQKRSIVNYFTRPDVIRHLIEYITVEPDANLPMAHRYHHANMACEILTLGLPSLDEKILSDTDTLETLYAYLENKPPLNPLLSSFFSKTFSMLFTKKAEQDWFLYQQMCLKLLEYLKSKNNFLDLICNHFETPIIPDLIMQMMKEVEGGQLKRNLYEWLTEEKLVDRLIALLGNPEAIEKHDNVAEFLCDLIQQGRTMRQTEEENDSFEPAFDGSNPILKSIECPQTVEALLNVILEPNARESAIISGISVVLTLIKPVVFVEEAKTDRLQQIHNREKEIHENILASVIRVIVPRLKDFIELLKTPPYKPRLTTPAATLESPFGMTRLQICRLFTVLLQTKNEEVSQGICATEFLNLFLDFFKNYCWNNFLHAEMEKCVETIFYIQPANNNNSTQGSTIVNEGSYSKSSNNGDGMPLFYELFKSPTKNINNNNNGIENNNSSSGHRYEDRASFRIAPGTYAVCGPIGARPRVKDYGLDLGEICNTEDEPIETARAVYAVVKSDDTTNDNLKEDLNDSLEENANADTSDEDNEHEKEKETLEENANAIANDNEMDKETLEESSKAVANVNHNEKETPEENANAIENNNDKIDDKNDNDVNTANVKESLKSDDDVAIGNVDQNDIIPNSMQNEHSKEADGVAGGELSDTNETEFPPITPLQTHAIVECRIVPKLLECWRLNTESQAAEKPRRLGYMGHLIRIFKHIANCVTEYDNVSALIEKNFCDSSEIDLWFSLMSPMDGDLHKELGIQSRFLANYNGQDPSQYQQRISRDFPADDGSWNYPISDNMLSAIKAICDPGGSDIIFPPGYDFNNVGNDDDNLENDSNLFQFGRNTDAYNDDIDPDPATSECLALFSKSLSGSSTFNVTSNPWDNVEPFNDMSSGGNTSNTPWSADFGTDNFADFESHFNSFSNDMGEALPNPDKKLETKSSAINIPNAYGNNDLSDKTTEEEYDNNANVEKPALLHKHLKINDNSNSTTFKQQNNANTDIEKEQERQKLQLQLDCPLDSDDDYDDDEGMWTKPLGVQANEDNKEDIMEVNRQRFRPWKNEIGAQGDKEINNDDNTTTINTSSTNSEAVKTTTDVNTTITPTTTTTDDDLITDKITPTVNLIEENDLNVNKTKLTASKINDDDTNVILAAEIEAANTTAKIT